MERELFEKAPIAKAYLKLALPVVFSMVLNVVYNMADTWFISLTGDPNLVAGVSVCSPVFVLSIAMGDIWGLGGSSLISRLLGQKRDRDAGGISAFCLYASFCTGIIYMSVLLLFRNPILHLLGANSASFAHASAYYTWIALGTPFIVFTLIPNNQLRSEGLAVPGMWAAIAGSAANMILDPLFIFGLNLGAAGAAAATSISNVLTCALYVMIILRNCHVVTMDITRARIAGTDIVEILRIGIPASVTNMMSGLGMMLTNRSLEPYGNKNIAAMGIAMKINMFCLMVLIAFAFGGQPLFGYCYGSRNTKRFRQTLRFALLSETGVGACFALTLFFGAPHFMRLFLSDPEVVQAGIKMLRFMQISSLLVGVTLITTCVCQAVGNAAGALLLSLSRQGIVFFLAITVLPMILGFTGILLAQPVSDLLTGVIAVVIMRKIIVIIQHPPELI